MKLLRVYDSLLCMFGYDLGAQKVRKKNCCVRVEDKIRVVGECIGLDIMSMNVMVISS